MPDERELLRHALAALAYRAAKSVRDAPPGFADFDPSPTTRSPIEVLRHLGDLMEWGLASSRGETLRPSSSPGTWDAEVGRFFAAITAWDAFLAGGDPLARPAERLLQGAIADALTHVGQVNMLRRMAGAPVRGENYARAAIAIGRTGLDQPPPPVGSEFD